MENTEGAESFNPLEASCSPMSSLTTAPLDFSQLTPSKLGISTQSFIPSNIKEKSRLAQLKLKRRSSVGVRGSPETNSLIRYIAQQRMKTPPSNALSTLASPFSTQGPSTLKQKMAIFQNIMDVVEDETTHQSSPTVGRIPTRDVLSAGGWSCDGGVAGKENKTPVSQLLTPPPSKRRCTADSLGLCAEEIREANPPDLKHTGTSQKMHNELAIGQNNQHQRDLTPGAPPQNELCGVVDHAPRIDAVSRITHGEPQPSSPLKEHRTPTKEEQDQGHSFELHSPSQTLDVCSGPDTTTLALLFPMPSHLEIKPTDEADSSGDIVNSVVKRKQVRFGIPLPPELFDKNLPPSTPLQKGGTPARVPTSAGGSQLRSLLKTPQRTPLGQPDFCSPSLTGASPTLTVKPCLGEPETANTFVQITFPSLEDEVDCSFTNHAELHAQPLDLNSAFQEEDTVCEAPPSAESLLDPVSALGPEPAPVTTTPARSSSRKRKLLEEKEPVKRSTRMAAKSACGRMKNAGKRGFGKKAVDRSLYGKRDYASKNPGLSPITEALSLPVQSNVCCRHTANQHSCLEDVINDVPVTGEVVAVFCTPTPDDIPATDPSYGPSVDCCVPAGCSTVSGPGRATRSGRRRSGPTKPTRTNKQSVVRACRRGRGECRKVSVPVDSWLNEEIVDNHEPGPKSPGNTQADVSESGSTNHTVPVDGPAESDAQQNLHFLHSDPDRCCGAPLDSGGRAESPVRADTEHPSGQVSPTAAPPGQVSPTVAPPRQVSPTVAPPGQVSPTVAPPGQVGPTVAPPGQVGPTVAPPGQVGPTVAPPGQVGPTVAPPGQVGPTVAPPGQVGPTVAPPGQVGPNVAPPGQVGPTVAPPGQVGPTVAPPGQEAASYVEPIPNRGKPNVNAQSPWLSRGRRSHLYASALPEENEEEQTFQSGSPKAQMEIDSTFPSWAQDFNIDDVLQPLPSRGRKSVRRSLRNLSQNGSLDPSRSGLAWLPHNSPDSIKTERRKTRSRRSSIQAALHLVEWDHMTL